MAIYIRTQNPQRLIEGINRSIQNRDIVTWTVDKEGDYTIDRDQWRFRAWMKPTLKEGQLVMSIIQSRKFPMTNELYAVYHGRFVSTVIAHFSDEIEGVEVTPHPIIDVDVIETQTRKY